MSAMSDSPAPTDLAGNQPLRLISTQIDPVYENLLLAPCQEGWIGSDVGCSVPLSPEKSLWLFGDTFIGRLEGRKRVTGAAFINNSIGIQDRTTPGAGSVSFCWGHREDGTPGSFFPHQEGTLGHYYWPTMGMLLHGELFIYNYACRGGFDNPGIPGSTVIRVPNPQDPPEQWEPRACNLNLPPQCKCMHSAVYIQEPYVYFMGSGRHMVLGRCKSDAILSGATGEAYEFWTEGPDGPRWSTDAENLVPLFARGVTESMIQYVPDWGLYLCTIYGGRTPEIWVLAAPELTGPWSEPLLVYQVPEHRVSFPIISYAARCHPELSTKTGELVISYETNAPGDIKPLFTDEGFDIYWPRFIRVQLERV